MLQLLLVAYFLALQKKLVRVKLASALSLSKDMRMALIDSHEQHKVI